MGADKFGLQAWNKANERIEEECGDQDSCYVLSVLVLNMRHVHIALLRSRRASELR